MGFLSKLFGPLLGRAPSGSDRYLPVYALSHRCHEAVAGQIDLMNEVSLDDENAGGYYVRKVLHTSGRGRCFAEVELDVWLDAKKRVVRQEVHGGRWLTAEEYAAEWRASRRSRQQRSRKPIKQMTKNRRSGLQPDIAALRQWAKMSGCKPDLRERFSGQPIRNQKENPLCACR